jgi:hypothetical protein
LTYVIIGASSSLATASSELENLRSSYQELETKLKEAELKREQAEKQLAEKNSEHIREKGEFILKRNADSETIKRQQKELYGFQKYMETAEHHWDLLNENILGTMLKPCLDVCSDLFLCAQIACLYPDYLMQSRLGIRKSVGICSHETTFFNLQAMIAKISSPPPARYATTYPSRGVALATFANLLEKWTFFRSW